MNGQCKSRCAIVYLFKRNSNLYAFVLYNKLLERMLKNVRRKFVCAIVGAVKAVYGLHSIWHRTHNFFLLKIPGKFFWGGWGEGYMQW